MADPNLNLLAGMAQALGPICERLVFVGGCATGLLLDDAGLMDVRPTEHVDAIVEVASLAGYHALAGELAQRGFKQTMADNTPPFRWFWNRMQLDLVPVDERVLGFANRWYRSGFEAAVSAPLGNGLVLRHLSAPHFLATKFEAFKDRGKTTCTSATIWKTSSRSSRAGQRWRKSWRRRKTMCVPMWWEMWWRCWATPTFATPCQGC